MKIGNVIKKECEPILSKYGFKYLGTIASGIWGFERFEGEIKQEIYFQKSNYSKSITGEIEVKKKNGNSRLDMSYFIGMEGNNFLEYETEEDLKEILKKLLDGFENNNGMETLKEMNVVIIDASEDMYKKVMENSAERAEKFKNEYNLNYNWDIRNAEKLEEILNEKRERTNIVIDEEFLISAAAYYGELIINNFGGKWVFYISEDYDGYSYIEKIAEQYSKSIILEFPLAIIMNYYSSPNFFENKLTYKLNKLDNRIKKEKENNK
jgi:hypothetical protein